MKKPPLMALAKEVFGRVMKTGRWFLEIDETGSIGKRYRRQDELGTPFCFTIDFESLDDKKVTIRDRDTTKQERIDIDAIEGVLARKIAGSG
jgi:glycyl-tRNA synthetase